ncbi:hypothetical protein [Kribbella deserti]|uniref:Uncharacterized protein n=1 Tax=Kribbella deserti TaxID=1926257 RepID=A0ABV6QF33_9ACTN
MTTITMAKSLPQTVMQAMAFIAAIAWQKRRIPPDGVHPAWCDRRKDGCEEFHHMPYSAGRGAACSWHLSARVPIVDADEPEPRVTAVVFHQEAGWFINAPEGRHMAMLELNASDARALALDLLRMADRTEGGTAEERQS